MKKIVFLIISFICAFLPGFGQKRAPIQCTADLLRFDEHIGNIQIFTGNVEFRHEGSIGYADTVLYFQEKNALEAFGREIIIHINDSVHLYGKHVHYDGETRIATIYKDVMLADNRGTLYTDELTYYRNEDYACYLTGGRIESDSAILTSHIAHYYTRSNDVYFRRNVKVIHPDFTLNADTLRYNTASKTVFFTGPTEMHAENRSIWSKDGWYQTETEAAAFYQRSLIYSEKQLLTADSVHYENMEQKGRAYGNILLLDTQDRHCLQGNYMEFDRQSGYAFATDSAMVTYIEKGDTLFLHADTLWADIDSNNTIQKARAYPQTRFFRKDFQGRCGQLLYVTADSLIHLLHSPVIWSDSNQIIADTVLIFLQGKKVKEAHLLGHAFVSENVLANIHFNQVKSPQMTVYFRNNQLDYAIAEPTAECLYYILEKDTELVGIHQAQAEKMRIRFEDNEIKTITFYRKVKGEFGPDSESDKRYLPDFQWLMEIRPQKQPDIFKADHHERALLKEDENDE